MNLTLTPILGATSFWSCTHHTQKGEFLFKNGPYFVYFADLTPILVRQQSGVDHARHRMAIFGRK